MRRLWLPVLVSTSRDPATLEQGRTWRLFRLLAGIAALTMVLATAPRAHAVAHPPQTERNFVAVLHPVSGGPAHAFGAVLFRQPYDAKKIVFLDVWTLALAPNHSYSLQRATDTIVDDDCQGTNWLTLGRDLEPQAIETNEVGFGRAHLFRDLAAVPEGTRFDIHFRVIDPVTQVVMLASSCHQFTVSP